MADLRRDIRSLSRDIDAAYDEADATRSGQLDVPDGTQIKVRLEERVSSKTARVEDRVVGTVAETVVRNGRTAIPAGTPILGTVERAERALIGAIVGGGGTVVASSGDDVELPAGSLLTVELERPLTLTRR